MTTADLLKLCQAATPGKRAQLLPPYDGEVAWLDVPAQGSHGLPHGSPHTIEVTYPLTGADAALIAATDPAVVEALVRCAVALQALERMTREWHEHAGPGERRDARAALAALAAVGVEAGQ